MAATMVINSGTLSHNLLAITRYAITRIGSHPINAGTARDCVFAFVHRSNVIRPPTSEDAILASTADQGILASSTEDAVLTATAIYGVGAIGAGEGVLTIVADNRLGQCYARK